VSEEARKPLGGKAYGSIPHLLGSRRGPADKGVNEGQQRICTEQARDRYDEVIVQLKLDGSNVAVALINSTLLALTRAGYLATTSPYPQHHLWASWVDANAAALRPLLLEGEWLSGEWLAQAHGTRYDLTGRSPFVAFDLWSNKRRLPYDALVARVGTAVPLAPLLHRGGPLPVDDALALTDLRLYGELDTPEGAVWRVERVDPRTKVRGVDFLAKYVRPGKVDGAYLPDVSGTGETVWNWRNT
jgi:hypothetical protein